MADLRDRLEAELRGRYTLERELGRGGMATVFLAQDLKHDRPVALKVLHPELAATLGPERFQREIQLAARLQHPHILTVLDSGETAGQLWFTMPFVEGESLRDRLRRERQLPVEDALRIAREAAQALDYAHQHGVIHRDIKPENILLTTDGNTLVADFGIARALAGGATEQRSTADRHERRHAGLHEPGAGERRPARSTPGPTSTRSGCVLYEMLAGEPPYTGPTAQAILLRSGSPRSGAERARDARHSVPEAVDQAVQRALARSPADRFATAAEFAPRARAGGADGHGIATPRRDADRRVTPRRPGRATGGACAAAIRSPLALLGGLRDRAGRALRLAPRPPGDAEAASGGCRGAKLVAVLPFENLGDSDDAYFADGVTDEVRGKLSRLPGLEVIARGSSNEYKKTTKPPQEIARELGVDYLLTGTVRWEKGAGGASRVRVSPELVQVATGRDQVAAAVRRVAHRRVPGAGRHRGQGGAGAQRGPRRRARSSGWRRGRPRTSRRTTRS